MSQLGDIPNVTTLVVNPASQADEGPTRALVAVHLRGGQLNMFINMGSVGQDRDQQTSPARRSELWAEHWKGLLGRSRAVGPFVIASNGIIIHFMAPQPAWTPYRAFHLPVGIPWGTFLGITSHCGSWRPGQSATPNNPQATSKKTPAKSSNKRKLAHLMEFPVAHFTHLWLPYESAQCKCWLCCLPIIKVRGLKLAVIRSANP